ncbi:MAG TPA: amidohydrolase family protein [Pelobium sp.]
MLKIDTHQHFWKYSPHQHAWISDEMAAIQRDFLPADLQPLLNEFGISACIAVQADESETDNDFLLGLAKKNDFIKGVIGWLDYLDEGISSKLAYYSDFKELKGFRYVLQGKEQRDLMLDKNFVRGIAAMKAYDFVYELLIYPDQLGYAAQLVDQFPNQVFVLNHIAKPLIKLGEIEQWKSAVTALAQYHNVYCKVSGMVTEADWINWKYQDFVPYLDVIFSAFGTDRVMFGSDWPVCNLAGNYPKVVGIVDAYLGNLSLTEQENFWGLNASKCYKL